MIIRNEEARDWQRVEDVTREAFYNLYVPGCVEHYLVHIMRDHEDFVPELDFVVEEAGQVIGNIMYTKARLSDEAQREKVILTFGPVCVLPPYQRQGYGRRLIEHSLDEAKALGYDCVVIMGDPANYVSRGFKSCRRYNIALPDGAYPAALLVKELTPGALDGRKWIYQGSPIMQIDEAAAQRFDAALPPMEKRVQPSQEVFYILSHAVIQA